MDWYVWHKEGKDGLLIQEGRVVVAEKLVKLCVFHNGTSCEHWLYMVQRVLKHHMSGR